ncbi:MAG: hypothetical protein SVV80_07565 [Planctomycetota bacterium]|nr:hypothetical protein [Planctomycetota bacterium]
MSEVRTVEIPESVLASAQTLDELGDWLSAHNPNFLEQMRRIHEAEDIAEKGKDLTEILKQWPIE